MKEYVFLQIMILIAVGIMVFMTICSLVGCSDMALTEGRFNEAQARTEARLDSLESLIQRTNQKIDSVSLKIDSAVDTINQRSEELRNGQKSIIEEINKTRKFNLW